MGCGHAILVVLIIILIVLAVGSILLLLSPNVTIQDDSGIQSDTTHWFNWFVWENLGIDLSPSK